MSCGRMSPTVERRHAPVGIETTLQLYQAQIDTTSSSVCETSLPGLPNQGVCYDLWSGEI